MPKQIVVPFSLNGSPQTGLSPTINVRQVDTGALLVSGASMVEVGDGFYRYEFLEADGYDPELDFVALIDSGSPLQDVERYAFGASDFGASDFKTLLQSELDNNQGGFLA